MIMIKKYLKLFGKILGIIFTVSVIAYVIFVIVVRPSNDRDWMLDQAVLPYADIDGNRIAIHNIRNFTYQSTSEYTPNYYDATFDLEKLKNIYFIVEPFSGFKGA